MIVKSLTVEQYRGFVDRTVIEFDPHFTVLVGENGAGKTSVLWALRVLLSHTVAKLEKGHGRNLRFQSEDIAAGWPYLRAESVVEIVPKGATATCVAYKNAEKFVRSNEKDGTPREHAVDTPDRYHVEVTGAGASPETEVGFSLPLAVYYSAHRSLVRDRRSIKTRAAGGRGTALAAALEERELSLSQAALLWRKEAALAEVDGRPAGANHSIEQALPRFLDGLSNLRIEGTDYPRLVVDKCGKALDLGQLSDGELGILAVLIDLARRLAQADPELEHPVDDGRAIVLIDELDLHIHPHWQREVVQRLKATFPNCQFIATTHSPQIIGEIQPVNLVLLRLVDGRIMAERCGQTYGLDVSHVIEHIMGTAPRAAPASDAINAAEKALELGDLTRARDHIAKLRTMLHGDDAAVVGLEAAVKNLEALGNADDPEKS